MIDARWIGWILVGAGTLVAVYNLIRWYGEIRSLRRVMRRLTPDGRITTRDDLIRVRTYLNEHIAYDPARKFERRPFLRSSASDVLRQGHGFCGENARVAVWLLNLGGIRAHRLYIVGRSWGHVVVEHRWAGGWRMFDGHRDPGTRLPDEAVGRLRSDEFERFPNAYSAENRYVAIHRNKSFYGVPALRALARIRPPRALALAMETPWSIAGTGGLVLATVGLAIALR